MLQIIRCDKCGKGYQWDDKMGNLLEGCENCFINIGDEKEDDSNFEC